MRCQWREGKERSGNVIGEMTALRWEPTHVTKYCPRVVPLQASTEWSSLMSIVPISTGRSREVPCASRALIEKSLGSLFSYLGLQSRAETRGIEGGVSTSSLSIVLGSSIVNTVNLFTGDWGALIAGRATQNPLPPEDKTLLSELHFSTPIDLQSTPPTASW